MCIRDRVYIGKDLNRVLVSAEDEAKAMGDEYVSVEHLFLSLLRCLLYTSISHSLQPFGRVAVLKDHAIEAVSHILSSEGLPCIDEVPDHMAFFHTLHLIAKHLIPVSYTHLDVYKRQDHGRLRMNGQIETLHRPSSVFCLAGDLHSARFVGFQNTVLRDRSDFRIGALEGYSLKMCIRDSRQSSLSASQSFHPFRIPPFYFFFDQ